MIARLNRVSNVAIMAPVNLGNEEATPDVESPPMIGTRESAINYFDVREEERPFPGCSILYPLDLDQRDDIRAGTAGMLEKACRVLNEPLLKRELHQLVQNNQDILLTSFSSGPSAKTKPSQIQLTHEAKPFSARLQKYLQEQKDFLARFVKQLVEAGMANFNPSATWDCAPLLVPKAGPALFRFTVDLRPVNRFMVKHQFPMHNLEQKLLQLSSFCYFAVFGLSHGYWQLPLSKRLQDFQPFITPEGFYTPTWVPHGTMNAVMYLRSTFAAILPDRLRPNIFWWLNDILLHSATSSNHICVVTRFFDFCGKFNFKLHPRKCTLFASSFRWCGRVISPIGILFDPRRIDRIRQLYQPKTGADL